MSSSNNKGLGRGLAALIGSKTALDAEAIESTVASTTSYQELPVSQISGNPDQPRTVFDEEALSELAESIAAVGLVQPVVVRPLGNRFELIAGERRWRASQRAGLETIPAIIREAGDAESLELALIENINRVDLNPIDTARAYACLQEDFGITQEQLAGKMGRSRSAVANTLRLLDLPDEIQSMLEQGQLSEGHGRALLSVGDRLQQKKLAVKVVAQGLTVRQTEKLAKKDNTPRPLRSPANAPVDQELMDETTDALYSAFRMPVKVRWSGKSGRVEMEFSSEEQLRFLLDSLGDR